MTQEGPAIHPTPPSIITNNGMWADALLIRQKIETKIFMNFLKRITLDSKMK